MDRDEEYKKVFGVKPKKPRKSKKPSAKKPTKKVGQSVEPTVVEGAGAWDYYAKKPVVGDKKTKKNINFLIGLAIAFVAMLIIGWIFRLFSMVI